MAKNKLNEWSLTALRVVLGLVFVYHGYIKLFVEGGFKGFVDNLLIGIIGLPSSIAGWVGLVVAVIEFFGGVAMILGVLTRYVSMLQMVIMLVAFFKVHLVQGFDGYKFVLVLMAGLLVVLTNGAGKLALGKMFKSKSLQ